MQRRTFLGGLTATGIMGLTARETFAESAAPFPVRTLGTGAADYDYQRFGEPGIRGFTSTLLDGHILIDCGRTGFLALQKAGVPADSVTDIVFTHAHGDHYFPGQIAKLVEARGEKAGKLQFWAVAPIASHLEKQFAGKAACNAIEVGKPFTLGRSTFTPLPANHQLGFTDEATEPRLAMHFLVETPRGNLLYALDGAWMLKHARLLIGKKKLAMIVWDATMSNQKDDFRKFEHNNLDMISEMMRTLTRDGVVAASTQCILSHMAQTLWPASLADAQKLLPDPAWQIAEDGKTFSL